MSNEPITGAMFRKILPVHLKKSVNDELIDKINTTLADPLLCENYRENLFGYASVLKEGKFKMEGYLNGIKYVSYKLMGDTNIAAYTKTFPDKYQRFLDQGVVGKDIQSYVTAYNKSKLVNLIYEQTLIPSYILNADIYQKAINQQAHLMIHSKSEKVQSEAANSILNHLKRPEKTKIELDIGLTQDSTLTELRETTAALVAQQKALMEKGLADAQQIAHSKIVRDEIIEGEFEETSNA